MVNDETAPDRAMSPAYAMTKTAEQAGTAIEVKGLQTYLFTRSGVVKAVDDVLVLATAGRDLGGGRRVRLR